MRIETFPVGAFQVNSYLLFCEETGASVVVDPGDPAGALLARYEELAAEPIAVLNTHGHLDHVAGNSAFKERYDIPIYLHPDDRFLLDTFERQAAMYGLSLTAPPPPDRDLVVGETVAFGECRLDVLGAPGHSPGHVLLLNGRDALSGDVLFAGSIGRSDLPGGDLRTLLTTIDEVLLPLGDDLVLHPGHGPSTTIGQERATNPFLQAELREHLLREA